MRNIRLIVVAYAASALLYARLPEGTESRGLIAFLLPTAAAVIAGVAGVLGRDDPFRDEEDTLALETTERIVSAGVLFVVLLHFLILLMLLTRAAWGTGAVLLLAGAALMFTGNALPRTRPNMVVGIRTERTLASRRVWLRTHRAVGNIAVGLGGATAVAAFLPHDARMVLMSGVLLVGVGTLVASVLRRSHV